MRKDDTIELLKAHIKELEETIRLLQGDLNELADCEDMLEYEKTKRKLGLEG